MPRDYATPDYASAYTVSRRATGTFKRDEQDSRPGKPIPFGERPPGRPLASELGNGRNFATSAVRSRGSGSEDTYGAEAIQLDRRKWADQVPGIRRMSWEKD